MIDLYQLPHEVEERAGAVELEEELGRRTYAVLELLQEYK